MSFGSVLQRRPRSEISGLASLDLEWQSSGEHTCSNIEAQHKAQWHSAEVSPNSAR